MKKIFIVFAVFLSITLVLLGVYNFIFKKPSKAPAVVKKTDNQLSVKSDSAGNQNKIYAISEEAVIAPFVDRENEKIKYYAKSDGTVWQSELDGKNKKQLEEKNLTGLVNVKWSPSGDKVLSEFNKDQTKSFFEYDYNTRTGKSLDSGVDYIVWDNMGTSVIYKFFDKNSKTRSLSIANPDGSNWKKLTDIEFKKVSISSIPQTSLISYWNYPSALEESKVYTIGRLGGNAKIIFSGKFGADYLWAPNGQKALVSSLVDKSVNKMNLGLIDINGQYQDLKIPTFISKAVWSSDNRTVYYAIAGGIPETAVLPDEYDSGKFLTTDTFWKVNIETGKSERILLPEEIKEKFDASQMILSPNEDALFFINKRDGKLYKMEI